MRTMQVAVPSPVRGPAFDELLELLRLEVNVKRVDVVGSDAELVRLRPKPNFRSLGKRYAKRTPAVAEAMNRLTPDQLRALESGQPATLDVDRETVTVLPEDVTVEREVTSAWLVRSDGPYVVALDPELDEELRSEGFAREVVSRVQRLRKEAGYEYTTRINLWVDGDGTVIDALRPHLEFVRGETLARCLEIGARTPSPEVEQTSEIDGRPVVLGMQRYEDRA
jgi:isoleucyl-tRNA synthetase